MSFKPPRITVSIAQTQTEVKQATEFCGSVYQRNYGTRWTVPPDLFFVAKENGEIVATGGLTFAARHTQIASERYYRLTDGMRDFIAANRETIVEFGRFASVKVLGAKAIMHSTLAYCTRWDFKFLFAWANPTVSHHTSRLGLNLWPISVSLDLNNAVNDLRWATPPTGFFMRARPPALHLVVVPFCGNVIRRLAQDCGFATATPVLQTPNPAEVHATMKSTSFVHAAPKLIRTEADVGAQRESGAFPDLKPPSEPAPELHHEPPHMK